MFLVTEILPTLIFIIIAKYTKSNDEIHAEQEEENENNAIFEMAHFEGTANYTPPLPS